MRFKRLWQATIAVGSAVVGGVFGIGLQELITEDNRITWAIVTVLAAMAIGLFATLLIYEAILQESRNELRQKVGDLNATVKLNSHRLAQQIEDVSQQFGLSVTRVSLDEIGSTITMEDDVTAQHVLNARRELLILDLLPEDGHWPIETLPDEYSRTFYGALIAHAEKNSPPLVYKRIIQVENVHDPFRQAVTESMRDHCRDMLELRERKGRNDKHRIALRVAPKRVPYKFMVIDETILVVQLLEYDGANLRLSHELVISDPRGELATVFRDIWNEIEQQSAFVEEIR